MARSWSAVSVLVAIAVFVAAYMVPGGPNDHGLPNLINSPLISSCSSPSGTTLLGWQVSLVSVMMFFSVLTSSFQLREFYRFLPRKLTMGFTSTSISLTSSTMLAFGSTILLTIRMENEKWSSSLIYSVTFFRVTLFGLTQFPIGMAVKYRTKRLWKESQEYDSK